jgi:hypothetical protein
VAKGPTVLLTAEGSPVAFLVGSITEQRRGKEPISGETSFKHIFAAIRAVAYQGQDTVGDEDGTGPGNGPREDPTSRITLVEE